MVNQNLFAQIMTQYSHQDYFVWVYGYLVSNISAPKWPARGRMEKLSASLARWSSNSINGRSLHLKNWTTCCIYSAFGTTTSDHTTIWMAGHLQKYGMIKKELRIKHSALRHGMDCSKVGGCRHHEQKDGRFPYTRTCINGVRRFVMLCLKSTGKIHSFSKPKAWK